MPADPLHGVLPGTHAWVWLIEVAPQMEAFRAAEGEQRVAAISVWEVAMHGSVKVVRSAMKR